MPLLFARLVLSRTAEGAPKILRPITNKMLSGADDVFFHPEMRRLVDYLTDHLGRHPYFTGDIFTAADIQMAYPIKAICTGHGNPVLEDWLARVSARPAQLRAEAKGAGIKLPSEA